MAFFKIGSEIKYAVFCLSTFIAIDYLYRSGYSLVDKWWPVGAMGLIIIAMGFATDAVLYPFAFNVFLGAGSAIVAVYSALGFFLLKDKIAMIWLILNIFFSANPLFVVFSRLF